MVYARGQYPGSALGVVPSISLVNRKPGTVKVLKATAAAFNAMRAEIYAETGQLIAASGPVGGYRSLSTERWMRTHYRWLWPQLAPVGYSNHNEADCIDLFDHSIVRRDYLNTKLAKFGFSRPLPGEPWHLQHNRSTKWMKGTVMADPTLLLYRREDRVKQGTKTVTVKVYFTFDGHSLIAVPGPASKVTLLRQALGLTSSTKRTQAQLDQLAAAGARHLAAMSAALKG